MPRLDPQIAREVKELLVRKLATTTLQPWTSKQVIDHKGSPSLKKRYTTAFLSLDAYGLGPHDMNVKAFIKVEKWQKDAMGVKPPRLIQYRSFRYCAALSRFLCPVEKHVWEHKHRGIYVFAKGRNSYQVAEMIVSAWDQFTDPVAVLLDHHRFDSSVQRGHIEMEEAVDVALCPDDELVRLFSFQICNRCYTKNGIKYDCICRKMSGEYNTSLGDSEVNYGSLSHVFGDDACYIINGDDSVIIMERNDLPHGFDNPATWAKYGFKSDVQMVDQLCEIDFCQSRPVLVDGVWRMVRKPWRAISRGCVSVKRYQGVSWRRLLASMAYSELACSSGVPMLQEFALYLMRAADGASVLPKEVSYKAKLEARPAIIPVSEQTRQSFAETFGIPVGLQLEFEEWCSKAEAVCLQLE